MRIIRLSADGFGIGQELPPKWIAYLAEQPETGMGYQIASVKLEDGTFISEVAITNCQYLTMTDGSPANIDVSKIVNIHVKGR